MQMTNCKGCKAPIYWDKKFGKPHPFNPDGSSHFDTCKVASSFRGRDKFFSDESNGSRQADIEKWRGRNLVLTVPPAIDWSVAEFWTFPADNLADLLTELACPGSPYPNGVAFASEHFSYCVTANDKVAAVITSDLLYREIYEHLYEEPLGDKPVYVKKYLLITVDTVPAEKYNTFIREQDRKYMDQLKSDHPERWQACQPKPKTPEEKALSKIERMRERRAAV